MHLCAVGRLRSGPERDLIADYTQRFDRTGRALSLGPLVEHEVEDKKKMESVLIHSDVYKRWRDYMEEFVYTDPESGEKEWFMKMVFYVKYLLLVY